MILASLALLEGNRELEWKEGKLAVDLVDMGDGMTSISDTPAGVKGVRESVKCHAPSGRRMAMRMSSPGLCSEKPKKKRKEKVEQRVKSKTRSMNTH